MAEKISTLILKVDLDCYRCYKEIRKILCKLQDKENIRTISYEEKSNRVIISGPFDPEKLSKKLQCKAGKVIKDIQIKEPEKEKPKETKPAEPVPKEKEKPKESKPAPPKPQKEKPKETEQEKPEKEKPKEDKPVEPETKPQKTEPEKTEPAKSEPVQAPVTAQPVFEPGPGPVCCPTPYLEGYYNGCRCCACGHIFGYVVGPTKYGPYEGCRVYHFFSEEDPSTSSCSIM